MPAHSVTVMPANIAIASDKTDAITEKAQLIPQYQATGASVFARAMPRGKHAPIKKPAGKIRMVDKRMRFVAPAEIVEAIADGPRNVKASRTTGSNQIARCNRLDHALPMLE